MPTAKSSRPALTRERLEAAALALIDSEGLDGFSTRKLAAHLGYEAMSIYYHFPSKGHLLEALLERTLGELLPLPESGQPWPERLRAAARQVHQLSIRHPNFFPYIAARRLDSRACLEWLDRLLGIFTDIAPDTERAVRLFRCFDHFVLGAAVAAANARRSGVSAQAAGTEPASGYRYLAAAGALLVPAEDEISFEAGLDVVLSGIGASLAG